MNILCTGNPNYGLAKSINNTFTNITFASRANGYDLSVKDNRKRLAEESLKYDIFINNSALFNFLQVELLYDVYNHWLDKNHNAYIINIGSTVEHSVKGRVWKYATEKKALQDAVTELAMLSVWDTSRTIRVSLLSFGSLNTPNVSAKHPNRTLIELNDAAQYVKWMVECPINMNINHLSIDPLQQ